jgi:CheY-like chemotaxis protein
MPRYVLVVDDDPDAREIQATLARSLGLEVQTANDGVEAMKLVYERIPDLILLDVMMPNLNGFGVLAKLRSAPTTRSIPVIVVTACSPGEREALRLPGVVDVITKGTMNVQSFKALMVQTLRLDSNPTASPSTH